MEKRGTMQQGEAFITTRSEQETEYLGALLSSNLECPLVIALNGALGSGKTAFVRGAAAGLGAVDQVSSPTFVLLRIYRGRLPLYHFDFYRLEEPEELIELGIEEFLPGEGAAFVEWAGRFPDQLPRERLDIMIEYFSDQIGEGRRIHFKPAGAAAANLVEKFFEGIAWRVNGKLHMHLPLILRR